VGKVVFSVSGDNVVGGEYSTGKGPVLRSDKIEVARVFFEKDKGSLPHQHPEEQIFYIVEGRLQVTLGEGDTAETYVVAPGQASFHPSNVPHGVLALEDVICISFKNLVDPDKSPNAVRNVYTETGRLDDASTTGGLAPAWPQRERRSG
jgi:quercetin dioxygenase-like cupin family protein